MTAAVASGKRFPDLVWDAPLLRGLDARARAELEAAGTLREISGGRLVHRSGDPADALYVVVEGACAVVGIQRGDARESVVRRVRRGELFGEDAMVAAFSTRALSARADPRATIAAIPAAVLRRAVARAGVGEIARRIERAAKRAAARDLLGTALGKGLSEADLEVLLDAARHVHVARGEAVRHAGDAAPEVIVVADGILSVQSFDEGRPRIEAYLSRGDVLGDEDVSVVAQGPAWLVAVAREAFPKERVRRVRTLPVVKEPRAAAGTTAHVFADVYRMRIARSLLVIDQDACIRCGHCAFSCASVHEDGIARLVRRGDKIVAPRGDADAPLLVPNSCQHCKNPACMIDCPTGAIARDAGGEVSIREDLCTGCGACAKACPWDNIQIASRTGGPFPEVAVKCDLCAGSAAGPACVAACPTEAIARIDPSAAFPELGAPGAGVRGAAVMPVRAAAWPMLAGASAAALGLALLRVGPWSSGLAAGALFVLLVAYAVAKRAPRLLARARRPGLARHLYVAHASLGILFGGITVSHAGIGAPRGAAGALVLATIAVVATGALGVAIGAWLPRRLARLERRSVLPEELGALGRELDERVFEKLSGKSEVVKALFARLLRPYRRARLGALLLVLSGRTIREEEARLRAAIDALLAGRRSERLGGLDEIVRLVVEQRAVAAQALLTRILRGWLPLHLAAVAAACVLIVLHVIAVRGRP